MKRLDKRKFSKIGKLKRLAGETERNLRKTDLTLAQKAAFRTGFAYAALNLEYRVHSRRLCVREYLERLRKKIERGRLHDLWEVVLLAREATRLVNEFARRDPTFVSFIAERYEDWPLLEKRTVAKSRHSEFFAAIRLGAALPKQTRLRAFLAGEHPARSWAARLWETLDHYRFLIARGEDISHLSRSTAMGVYDVRSLEPWRVYPYFEEVMVLAGKLPVLDPDSKPVIQEWWAAAKPLFTRLAGDNPWEFDATLRRYSPSENPVIIRRDVVKAVKQAFFTLVREPEAVFLG